MKTMTDSSYTINTMTCDLHWL